LPADQSADRFRNKEISPEAVNKPCRSKPSRLLQRSAWPETPSRFGKFGPVLRKLAAKSNSSRDSPHHCWRASDGLDGPSLLSGRDRLHRNNIYVIDS
jgi:hypothetical protein